MQLDGFEKALTEDGGLRWWARLMMVCFGAVFSVVSMAFALFGVGSVLMSQEKIDTWKPSTATVVRIIRTADDDTSIEILLDESPATRPESGRGETGTLSAAGADEQTVSPEDFGVAGNSPFVVVEWTYPVEFGQIVVDRFTAREVDSEDDYRELRERAIGETFALWYNPDAPDQWDEDITPTANSLALILFLLPFFLSGIVPFLAGVLNRPALLVRVKDGRTTGVCIGLAIAMLFLLDLLSWPVSMYVGSGMAVIACLWVFGGLVKALFSPMVVVPVAADGEEAAVDDDANADEEPYAGAEADEEAYVDEEGEAEADEDFDDSEDQMPGPMHPAALKAAGLAVSLWERRDFVRLGGALALAAFIGMFVYFFVIRDVVLYRRVAGYLSAEGTVLGSAVREDYDEGTSYSPWVKYSYEVAGRSYTSTQYRLGSDDFDEEGSRDVVAMHPVGKAVTVWYDPADPSEAVLSKETHSGSFFGMMFLAPFIMVGIGGVWRGLVSPAYRLGISRFLSSQRPPTPPCRLPGWGVLRRTVRGWVLHRSGDAFSQYVNFAMGFGITCFIAIFVTLAIGFASVGNPTKLSRTYYLVVLGAAAAIGLYRMYRKSGLRVSVAIADRKQAVTVIDTDGQSHTLYTYEIKHWGVRTEPSGASVNDVAIMATTIVLHTRQRSGKKGTPRTIKVHQLTNPTMSNDVDLDAVGRRIVSVLDRLTRD